MCMCVCALSLSSAPPNARLARCSQSVRFLKGIATLANNDDVDVDEEDDEDEDEDEDDDDDESRVTTVGWW